MVNGESFGNDWPYTVTINMIIKMGSDESYFDILFLWGGGGVCVWGGGEGANHKKESTDHNLWRKRKVDAGNPTRVVPVLA